MYLEAIIFPCRVFREEEEQEEEEEEEEERGKEVLFPLKLTILLSKTSLKCSKTCFRTYELLNNKKKEFRYDERKNWSTHLLGVMKGDRGRLEVQRHAPKKKKKKKKKDFPCDHLKRGS